MWVSLRFEWSYGVYSRWPAATAADPEKHTIRICKTFTPHKKAHGSCTQAPFDHFQRGRMIPVHGFPARNQSRYKCLSPLQTND